MPPSPHRYQDSITSWAAAQAVSILAVDNIAMSRFAQDVLMRRVQETKSQRNRRARPFVNAPEPSVKVVACRHNRPHSSGFVAQVDRLFCKVGWIVVGEGDLALTQHTHKIVARQTGELRGAANTDRAFPKGGDCT